MFLFLPFPFLLQRYQSDAKIEQVDGFALVKEMAADMETMMGDKVEAIKVRQIAHIIIANKLVYNSYFLLFSLNTGELFQKKRKCAACK